MIIGREKWEDSMKHIQLKVHGKRTPHLRRDMWGHGIRPSKAMKGFYSMRSSGFFHPDYTWRMCCAAYRKRIRKNKIAKESRRRNRK